MLQALGVFFSFASKFVQSFLEITWRVYHLDIIQKIYIFYKGVEMSLQMVQVHKDMKKAEEKDTKNFVYIKQPQNYIRITKYSMLIWVQYRVT